MLETITSPLSQKLPYLALLLLPSTACTGRWGLTLPKLTGWNFPEVLEAEQWKLLVEQMICCCGHCILVSVQVDEHHLQGHQCFSSLNLQSKSSYLWLPPALLALPRSFGTLVMGQSSEE